MLRLLITRLGLAALVVLCACTKEPVKQGEAAAPAHCNECHAYVSHSCKNVQVTVNGMPKTQCVACHTGSIRMDSTLTDTLPATYTYHDADFIGSDGIANPLNDSLHANGTVNTIAGTKHCTMCHEYPSPKCNITATAAAKGNGMCFGCHNASIKSTANTVPVYVRKFNRTLVPSATQRTIISDTRFQNGDSIFSEAMAGHNNGTVAFAYNPVSFGTCNSCHTYKPSTGLHSLHVTQNSTNELKECISCHFNSVVYDSANEGSVVRRGQMVFVSAEGETLPLVNPQHHLNGTNDVAFRDNILGHAPTPNLFKWNPVEKSCANVVCHGGGDTTSAVYQKTFWH